MAWSFPLRRAGMLSIGALLGFAAPALHADGLRLGVGVDYSSGKYGGRETTDILSAPLWLGYSRGRFDAKLTVPYLRVKGPGDVIPGLTPVVDDDEREDDEDEEDDPLTPEDESEIPTTTESGIGDVTLSANFAVVDQPDAWRLAIGGKIKFPTADEDKNLGSGETDYAAHIDIERALGHLTPFLTIGHRWLGDPPDASYKNAWYASVGVLWSVRDGTSLDFTYDWGQASSNSTDDGSELSLGFSQRLGRDLRLQGYVLYGLSDGSPDWGGGASLTYYF